ncbi:MAG: hypothetical protein GC204_19240 [Chloroflexi bacterium]|nr:hypothetical protein [Chloroflexota bacterium]
MKRFTPKILLISALIFLSACNFFSQPVDLQTENLQNEQAGTQIAAVRATATGNADRMIVTLSSAQTAVGEVDQQSTRIVATLIAQGTLFVDGSVITPVLPTLAPQSDTGSPIPQIANPLLTPGAPQVSGQGSAQGDAALVPTAPPADQQAVVQPTFDPNGPSLTQIALSEKVGSDDCPLNPTTSFSTSATDIYITAVANNVGQGDTLTADFSVNGQTIKSYSWSPDFAIHGACIWFHMPPSDVEYTPGNWSVALTLNGAAVGSPIPFSITSDVPNQIDLTAGSGG